MKILGWLLLVAGFFTIVHHRWAEMSHPREIRAQLFCSLEADNRSTYSQKEVMTAADGAITELYVRQHNYILPCLMMLVGGGILGIKRVPQHSAAR